MDHPPLHRMFNEKLALKLIARRYTKCKEKIASQVEVLQRDAGFRQLCQSYYAAGYPDWLILMGVLNCMINWKVKIGAADVVDPRRAASSFTRELERLQGDSYPAWRFNNEEMDRSIGIFNLTSLITSGFELRRPDYAREPVERFLRQRMKHFDLDLPHKPLFGDPPGNWPDTESTDPRSGSRT